MSATYCSYCTAPIYWIATEGHGFIPIDRETSPAGQIVVLRIERHIPVTGRVLPAPVDGAELYTDHRLTCPASMTTAAGRI